MIKLSERMSAVAACVTPGLGVADIGCDHGYLPIYLVQQGITPFAIAMDIKEGPLQAAREHIHREGLEEKIKVRLSDGLAALKPGEAGSVILAGMGGRLVLKILEEGAAFLDQTREVQEVIAQPQSELAFFRRRMQEMGYTCVQEDIIFEDGKFYPLGRYLPAYVTAKAARKLPENFFTGDRDLSEEYGGWLLFDRHPVLKQYLEKEGRQLQQIREAVAAMQDEEARQTRLQEVEEKLRKNERAFRFFA